MVTPEQLVQIDRAAQLIEKYGLALVLLLILLTVLLVVFYMLLKGHLVPGSMLKRAEEDRDRMRAILEKEHEGVMFPLLEMVKNLKKDDSASRGE